jgi:nucleoside-diphosphate-sugar epimerase
MKTNKILVTGACGLVGRALTQLLFKEGYNVHCLDIHADSQPFQGDIRDSNRITSATEGCVGVVHLAAVSRVITAERDPDLCWSTNVDGLKTLLHVIDEMPKKPWLIFASSREVYGQAGSFPVDEDFPLTPVNIYGRSKVEGERLINEARLRGVRTCILRLSNVYGSAKDHHDRVVPAFARAALAGEPLRVDGVSHTFDFTHVSDVVAGILGLVQHLLSGGTSMPPIQFVSGNATTLGELASMSVDLAGSSSPINLASPRDFDVSNFVGNGARASNLLSWVPKVTLEAGINLLMADIRKEANESDAGWNIA